MRDSASRVASSHVKCHHPCFSKKAELQLLEVMEIGIGHLEYESGRWIGGEGDMRRLGFSVANRYVIRNSAPEPFRHVFFLKFSRQV